MGHVPVSLAGSRSWFNTFYENRDFLNFNSLKLSVRKKEKEDSMFPGILKAYRGLTESQNKNDPK